MEQRELEQAREQGLPAENRRKKGSGAWWKVLLAVALTLTIALGVPALLLGGEGLAMMEGYLLARFAFVEPEADTAGAADSALDAMVRALGDRWSYYYSAEAYQESKLRRENNYVGIGVTVTYDREEGLYVLSVTGGGPAEKAGVAPGDTITAVDGTSVAGDGRDQGAALIRGLAGSNVELTLLGADGRIRTAVCTRAKIYSPPASGRMLEGDIGYVYLANFYSGAADSFRQEVDALVDQGAVGLIVDLRSDPGGYIDELTEILDYLLPEGEVFRQHSRWWFESVTRSDAACVDLPFVTIVNGDTYSAAELLAAELREFQGSPVVGECTCGKGYSQLTFPLMNGGALGLSTATYCTGSGHSLIGEGIVPDVEVALTEGEDDQLAAALALLRQED